jgi:hypothetical protein
LLGARISFATVTDSSTAIRMSTTTFPPCGNCESKSLWSRGSF